MLRSLLSERAQEAYSTVSATDCVDYSKVKSAVFKAYEAQRQILGNGKKWERKANELSHLNLWRSLVNNVAYSESLCESVVLKQLKNSSPQRTVTFIM